MFAIDEDRVLRLARRPDMREAVEREQLALSTASRSGAPVPAVYETLEVDGRPGLVLERLEGADLLTTMLTRPWKLPAMPRVLGRLHASLHEIRAPAELPELRGELRRRLESELVPEALRAAAIRALAALPEGDRLYHGDFHPGNVLRRAGGYAVIDWKNVARADPAADLARTRLLMIGAWIPGLGSRLLQLPLAPFRWLLYAAYMRAYRRARAVDRKSLTVWRPVLAAARLAEDIPQERRRLIRIARRGLNHRIAALDEGMS